MTQTTEPCQWTPRPHARSEGLGADNTRPRTRLKSVERSERLIDRNSQFGTDSNQSLVTTKLGNSFGRIHQNCSQVTAPSARPLTVIVAATSRGCSIGWLLCCGPASRSSGWRRARALFVGRSINAQPDSVRGPIPTRSTPPRPPPRPPRLDASPPPRWNRRYSRSADLPDSRRPLASPLRTNSNQTRRRSP